MQIREFQLADYEAVIVLWDAAGIRISRSDDRAEIIHKLERDPDLFLVGLENDTLVAAVMGTYDGRRGWVYHLAIHPSHQGHGFGGAMIEELEERLRSKGCQKVNLLIELDNAPVQHFYKKLNYQHNDLIFMEKWLT